MHARSRTHIGQFDVPERHVPASARTGRNIETVADQARRTEPGGNIGRKEQAMRHQAADEGVSPKHVALAINDERLVSKADILRVLYGDDEPRETKVVDVYISRIRQKLKAMTGDDDLILNRRGLGWIFRRPH